MLLASLVLAGTIVGAGAGIASAQDADDGGVIESIRTVTSWLDAAIGWGVGHVESLLDEPADRDAVQAAADLAAEYNDSSGDIEAWANARVDATTSADVLELTFEVDGETATRYLVADVEGDDYANTSVVPSTNRSVDESCTLEDDAARNAADELAAFEDQFVDPDEDVSSRFLGRLDSRYDGQVDCSFNLNP